MIDHSDRRSENILYDNTRRDRRNCRIFLVLIFFAAAFLLLVLTGVIRW